MEATWPCARQTIQYDGSRNDKSYEFEGAEEAQLEPGPTLENADDLIPAAIQELISDEAKNQIQNSFVAITELLEEVLEQRLRATGLSVQARARTVMYGAVERIFQYQIRKERLDDTTKKRQ